MPLSLQPSGSGHWSVVVDDHPWIVNARPLLVWRRSESHPWTTSGAALPCPGGHPPDTMTWHVRLDETVNLQLTARRLDAWTWEMNGRLHNTGTAFIELARFHYLQGELVADAGLHRVVVYNWSDQPTDARIPLADLRLPGGLRCQDASVAGNSPTDARLEGQCLVCKGLPPHSLRVVDLTGTPA